MKKILFLTLLIHHIVKAQDGDIFPAQNPPKEILGIKITENITINGRLEEEPWRLAPIAKDFFKQFPDQGGKPKFDTQIKILYNKRTCISVFFAPILWVKKA